MSILISSYIIRSCLVIVSLDSNRDSWCKFCALWPSDVEKSFSINRLHSQSILIMKFSIRAISAIRRCANRRYCICILKCLFFVKYQSSMYFEIGWQSALIQFISRLEILICAEIFLGKLSRFVYISCPKNNRRQSTLILTKSWKKKSNSENSKFWFSFLSLSRFSWMAFQVARTYLPLEH